MAVSCVAPSMAQDTPRWWAPVAQDVAGAAWRRVDTAGFSSDATLVDLAVRRRAASALHGYWSTHLRADYAAATSLPGTDGETVSASQVYVAMLLDCERTTWLLAGAYAVALDVRDAMLVPLAHAGLEATRGALDRVARDACREVRREQTAQMRTAPAGAVLGRAPEP